jgi:hypothetical protein
VTGALAFSTLGCSNLPTGPLASGLWGGTGIAFETTAAGAILEFDCAHGAIDAAIALEDGRFVVTGWYVQEHGGPVRDDHEEIRSPAEYSGVVRGDAMTLTIALLDDVSTRGPFQLRRNRAPLIRRCL